MVFIAEAAVRHPGRAVLAGAVALGVVLAAAETSIGLTASLEHRELIAIGLDPGTYCDAHLITQAETGAEKSMHIGPKEINLGVYHQGVPDVFNRNVDLKAQYYGKLCLGAGVLMAKPDGNGKLNINVNADPDPAKSDVSLIVSVVPGTLKFTPGGDLTNALIGNQLTTLKAVAQAAGIPDFRTPDDGLDGTLENIALTLGYDAVGSGPGNCTDMALELLNQEDSKKDNTVTGPDAPQTMKQDVEDQIIKQYKNDHGKTLTYKDFNWHLTTNGGVPNQYKKQIDALHAQSGKAGITIPKQASYVPCTNETGSAVETPAPVTSGAAGK
jgi:hypothetical protein